MNYNCANPRRGIRIAWKSDRIGRSRMMCDSYVVPSEYIFLKKPFVILFWCPSKSDFEILPSPHGFFTRIASDIKPLIDNDMDSWLLRPRATSSTLHGFLSHKNAAERFPGFSIDSNIHK